MSIETHVPSSQTPSVGKGTGVRRFLWPIVPLVLAAASASGYLGARWAAEDLRAELALRPPVILFDMAGAFRGAAPDQLAAVVAREKARAERLADGGLLVIDAQAVIAAPPELYLDRVPTLNGAGGGSR